MITVFFLLSWTEYGIKNIKDSPSRFDEAKALLESMGGKVKDIYMTSGDYDMVMIAELPGDAVAKYALSLAQKGDMDGPHWRVYELIVRRFFATLADPNVNKLVETVSKALSDLGFHLYATDGTSHMLQMNGIPVERIRKVSVCSLTSWC